MCCLCRGVDAQDTFPIDKARGNKRQLSKTVTMESLASISIPLSKGVESIEKARGAIEDKIKDRSGYRKCVGCVVSAGCKMHDV